MFIVSHSYDAHLPEKCDFNFLHVSAQAYYSPLIWATRYLK